MIDSTERLTVDDRLDIAGDYLIEHDIRLIVDDDRFQTSGDIWCDAEAEFGKRIALICTHGRPIEKLTGVKVSYHYDHPEIAKAIVDVFNGVDGCTATWSGEVWNAVQVTFH